MHMRGRAPWPEPPPFSAAEFGWTSPPHRTYTRLFVALSSPARDPKLQKVPMKIISCAFRKAQLTLLLASLPLAAGCVTLGGGRAVRNDAGANEFIHLGAGMANPYLPLWEHLPDGEPRVFEDPDRPGNYRIYIIGSHDVRGNSYCGP